MVNVLVMCVTQGVTVSSAGPVRVCAAGLRDCAAVCTRTPAERWACSRRWCGSEFYLNWRSQASPLTVLSSRHSVTAVRICYNPILIAGHCALPPSLKCSLKKPSFFCFLFKFSVHLSYNLLKFCDETPHLELCKQGFQRHT